MTEGRTAALGALVLGACAIGFAPIFVRLTETGPAAAGFWRLALALPMLAPFAFRRIEGRAAALPDRIILLAGVFFALDLAFWHYGIALTSVTNATVLANLAPIVVTAAGWWLFRERPERAFLVGLALALAGVAVMTLGAGAAAPGRNPPLGDALSGATAIWYAAYFLAVRRARGGHGTASIMFWSSLTGVALLGIAMVALGEDVLPDTAAGWGACLGLALVHVTGQGAIAWALGRLPAATASLVVLVQPAAAALLGWLIFAEVITGPQAVGALGALAGVAIAQWASARAAQRAQ